MLAEWCNGEVNILFQSLFDCNVMKLAMLADCVGCWLFLSLRGFHFGSDVLRYILRLSKTWYIYTAKVNWKSTRYSMCMWIVILLIVLLRRCIMIFRIENIKWFILFFKGGNYIFTNELKTVFLCVQGVLMEIKQN